MNRKETTLDANAEIKTFKLRERKYGKNMQNMQMV